MNLKNLLLITCIPFLFCSCQESKTGENTQLSLVTEKQEISLGEEYYPLLIQSQGGKYIPYSDLLDYIQKVGTRLAKVSHRPHLPFEFEVINLTIPYAWSLPGGKIALSRGMLQFIENEAQLAAILAHEIAHSVEDYRAGRSILLETAQNTLIHEDEFGRWNEPLFFPFTHEREISADKLAIKYMVNAGYDPQALVHLKKMLLEEQYSDETDLKAYFTTHPLSEYRIQPLQSVVEKYRKGGYLGKQAYEDATKSLKKGSEAYDLLDGGYRAIENGNNERALELAEESLLHEAQEGLLYALKGKALLNMENYADALQCFDKAIEINPFYYEFFLLRGEALYSLQNIEDSKLSVERAQQLFPSAEGHLILGKLAMLEKAYELAELHFQISAHSHSKVSETAQLLLEQIKSEHHFPHRNILATIEKQSKGNIKIRVKNLGEEKAKNIIIRIDLVSPPHKMLVAREISLPDEIKPGGSLSLTTKIGPFHQKISKPLFIEALVVSAEFVSP